MSLAECAGTKFLLSLVQISFPAIQKQLEGRLYARIPAWTRSCAAYCRWPCFSRGVGLDDPQRSLPTPTILWFDHLYSVLQHHTSRLTAQVTIPKHLNSLFCFNSRGLLTALQIPTAWCNQHTCKFIFTEIVKSYSPTAPVNTPAYLQ